MKGLFPWLVPVPDLVIKDPPVAVAFRWLRAVTRKLHLWVSHVARYGVRGADYGAWSNRTSGQSSLNNFQPHPDAGLSVLRLTKLDRIKDERCTLARS